MFIRKFLKDTDGAAMVEFTIIAMLALTFLLGAVDFFFAFSQWNSVVKAVERGARIAAVSTPVDNGLRNLTGLVSGVNQPGDPMPANYFSIICQGASTSGGSCTGTRAGTYNASAMNQIVYGRGSSLSCTDATSAYSVGMCDIYSRITPANVTVEYQQTGLGFVGRPGGPVPTVTVSIRNLSFEFFFLNSLLRFGPIQMPPISATVTGEDLFSSAPAS